MAAQVRTGNPVYLSLEYDDTEKVSLWERRMEEKALKQRWPISDAKRVKIVERLLQVVESEVTGDFNAVAAAKALIAADRLNVEQTKIDLSTQAPDPHKGDYVMDITPADENGHSL